MENLRDVELAISRLSPTEQAQLRTRIAYEDSTKPVQLTVLEQTAWDGIADACKRRIRPMVMPVFAKQYGVVKFREVLDDINDYVDDSCGPVSMGHRRAIITTMISCLIDYVHTWQKQPDMSSYKAVFNMAGEIPHAVEQAFPGYAACGLLARIVPIAQAA